MEALCQKKETWIVENNQTKEKISSNDKKLGTNMKV